MYKKFGYYILDASGEPQLCEDIVTWGRFMETGDRQIAATRFGEVFVSTVFLGVDHGYGDEGPPILWESMVFGGPLDSETRRYTSRADANAGHTALCVAVVAADEPPPAADAVDPHAGNTGKLTPRDKESSS